MFEGECAVLGVWIEGSADVRNAGVYDTTDMSTAGASCFNSAIVSFQIFFCAVAPSGDRTKGDGLFAILAFPSVYRS